MSEKTIIAWTDRTWNAWRGCRKVSPGCKNCYMFTAQEKYGRDPHEVVRTTTWGDPLKWQKRAAAEGRTERVFTCSWSDWFIEEADAWRPEAWAVVRRCPNLTFQILTKRPERIADHLPPDWGDGYPNVWLGTSVEDQRRADGRIPHLLRAPAAVRFLSVEPLLEPVDLSAWLPLWVDGEYGEGDRGIDWVIVGGESGEGHRPMDYAWARAIRDQCREQGVAFFFKQSSHRFTERGIQLDGEVVREYPAVGRLALPLSAG